MGQTGQTGQTGQAGTCLDEGVNQRHLRVTVPQRAL